MGFESLSISRSYKTNKNNIVKEFFLPVLECSVMYKRAVGFFSSAALIELSKGISGIVRNRGKIQFIVSPHLLESDVKAIQAGYDRRKIIQQSLLREFKEPENRSEEERLNWIANLIADGYLDIKIAFTPEFKKTGMYHEKIGIIYDSYGNRLAFTGSLNETPNAFYNNFESIDVYNSLIEEDRQRVIDKENDFDSLWNNHEPNITILEFPRAVKEKILSYRKEIVDLSLDKIEADEEDSILEFVYNQIKPGEPVIPKNIDLFDYQIKAIDNWKNNDYIGIFDMATGTGKTYTGLGAITKLYQEKGKLAVIIVAPYQHLVEQWVEDIEKFNMKPTIGYSASRQTNWKKRLQDDIEDFKLGIINTFCFVTTNATFSSEFVQKQINRLGKDTLLMIDEAHNFGSPNLALCLNPKIEHRLALSATLDRHGDPEGTAILYNYFGEKSIEYDLDKAIAEDKLTPYYYYPVPVCLEDDEFEKYKNLSYEIAKECHKDKNGKIKVTNRGERKMLERSRLIAGARAKLPKLKELMEEYKDDTHILVYCGATRIEHFETDESERDIEGERQIVAVSKILGNELEMKVTHFTSNESAREREYIKDAFDKADPYQAIIAIKCLDEGVNIPSIKTAFILASTTNPKEYIQRRGRVLRKSPQTGKHFAVIYDFITLASPIEDVNPYNSSYNCERTLAKRELIRMKEFGKISKNSRDTDNLMTLLKEAYNITDLELEECFDGIEY